MTLNRPKDIAALLQVLRDGNVGYFKQGDLEIQLNPALPSEMLGRPADDDEDDTGWRGLGQDDLSILGAG